MKIKDELNKIYGAEENIDKYILAFSAMFLGIGLFFGWLYIKNKGIYTKFELIAYAYIPIINIVASIFTISSYFFCKKKNSEKYKFIKYVMFIMSVILMIVTALPVAVMLAGINKVRLLKLNIDNILLFAIYIVVLIVDSFSFVLILGIVIRYAFLDAITITLFIVFILNYMVLKLLIWMYFKIAGKIKKDKKVIFEEDYKYMKKIIYIFNFLIIAFGTAVIYFVNIKYFNFDANTQFILMQLKDRIIYVFAIYTAIDVFIAKKKESREDSIDKNSTDFLTDIRATLEKQEKTISELENKNKVLENSLRNIQRRIKKRKK